MDSKPSLSRDSCSRNENSMRSESFANPIVLRVAHGLAVPKCDTDFIHECLTDSVRYRLFKRHIYWDGLVDWNWYVYTLGVIVTGCDAKSVADRKFDSKQVDHAIEDVLGYLNSVSDAEQVTNAEPDTFRPEHTIT